MKIYGQTDDIIVREMTEDDCGKFLKMMMEHGTNEDFTVEDIRVLWKFRKEKGDLQCAVTSTDGQTVYRFCGILGIKLGKPEICVDIFNKYINMNYEEQVKAIMREYL